MIVSLSFPLFSLTDMRIAHRAVKCSFHEWVQAHWAKFHNRTCVCYFFICLCDEPELDGIFLLRTSSILEDKRSFLMPDRLPKGAFHVHTHTGETSVTDDDKMWADLLHHTVFAHFISLFLPLTHCESLQRSHEYSFLSLSRPIDERWGSDCVSEWHFPSNTMPQLNTAVPSCSPVLCSDSHWCLRWV